MKEYIVDAINHDMLEQVLNHYAGKGYRLAALTQSTHLVYTVVMERDVE